MYSCGLDFGVSPLHMIATETLAGVEALKLSGLAFADRVRPSCKG